MSETKTMVVIPKDLLESLRYNQKQQMGPIGERLITLDQEMKSILSQEGISDDDKARQYFQTLQKYMSAKEMMKTTEPPKQNYATPATPGKILNEIPSKQEKKAQKILNWLTRVAPDITWDEKGEVDGIPGSNIADLVTELTKTRSSTAEPTGFPQFADLLRQANIPRTLVSNTRQWDIHFAPSPPLRSDDIYEVPPSTSRDIFGTPPQTPGRNLRSTHRTSPSTQKWLKMSKRY